MALRSTKAYVPTDWRPDRTEGPLNIEVMQIRDKVRKLLLSITLSLSKERDW